MNRAGVNGGRRLENAGQRRLTLAARRLPPGRRESERPLAAPAASFAPFHTHSRNTAHERPPPPTLLTCSESEKSAAGSEAPAAPAAAAPGEKMDVNTAVAAVLKKALAHDGLSRGLHEAARALERGGAQLCVLADDCDQPDIKKLVEALCAEHNVSLLSVPESKQLGQWAGLCKLDADGEPRKVVGCSCAVVTDYGEETEGLAVLQEYLKSR